MLSYVEVITTPTSDTPGTLLLLHFDNRRYLIGNVFEGAQRACIERGIGLRKVSKILLTGRTEWSNIGGLLGLILSLADTKVSAATAVAESRSGQETNGKHKDDIRENMQVDVYGPRNLNHMIATSRRFIFRTGIPINAIECAPCLPAADAVLEPTWQDELVQVWSMAISPSALEGAKSPRKRTYDEANGQTYASSASTLQDSFHDEFLDMRKSVVTQMFSSGWRLDNLVPQPLYSVRLPAKIFVRDPDTKSLVPYDGPLPGGPEPVPNVRVHVREPWPGALTESLPPTKPALESMSYIVKNHPQRGKFLPQKAIELKVPKGAAWSELTRGSSVKNTEGETISPEMVLAPGKEGGGFAVVDLPTADYVEALLERPEWRSKEVMLGVQAIVWVLGPGVGLDSRLQKFQADNATLKHIVSSTDSCSNMLALDGAARNAFRHNHIDSSIFPRLQHSSVHNAPAVSVDSSILPGAEISQRGLRFTLEPAFEVQDKFIKAPLDLPAFEKQVSEELNALDNASLRDASRASDEDVTSWAQACPHRDAEVLVLGTGSSHPSRARNVSGTLLRVPVCGSYLLDCGEGTLGTLRRMFSKDELNEIWQDLRMIWVSHMHADHHLGLASILGAWNAATRNDENGNAKSPRPVIGVVSDAPMLHWLHEYGSAEDLGLSRVLPLATTSSRSDDLKHPQGTQLRFVSPAWCEDQDMRNTSDFLDILNLKALNSVQVSHCRGAQAVSFTTKTGLKVSYSGDCRPSLHFANIGQDSHLLIHEATFEDEMRNEALAKRHSTAGEALIVASQMKAKALLLTHFSQRYPEMPKLGVQLRGSAPPAKLHDVLEQQPDSNDEMPANMGATENAPASETTGTESNQTAHATLRRGSSAKLELLDQQSLQKILDDSGVRVIFAFDYMRVKLGDIPLLEKKQPLLREMYDKGIGKDVGDEGGEGGETESAAQPTAEQKRKQKEEQKKAKAAQFNKKAKVNKQRSSENKQKWANAVKDIRNRAVQDDAPS